jgi:hypothetical protein
LQARPAEDLAAFRQWESEILESYGWVDREKGVVRIPIDRAMELVVKQAFTVAEDQRNKTAPGPTWEEIMQQRVLQGAGGNVERKEP